MERIAVQEFIDRAQEQNPGEHIDCYLLFSSHFDAMALYEAARGAQYKARISTTPRAARSSCGVALLVSCEDAQAVCDLAWREAIDLEGIAALPCQIDPNRDRYC